MFYSANGNFENSNIIEKFTEIDSNDNIQVKFDDLNKKIADISIENKLLKRKINELFKLTKRLEIEKTDYFYLNTKN